MDKVRPISVALLAAVMLSACGGSARPTPITSHIVTLTWAASHQSGVNSAGGGYQVLINGKVSATVPYASGALAPTTAQVTLNTGIYSVAVRAYAALDAQGGSSGSYSALSQPLLISVP